MRIVKQSFEILTPVGENELKRIEQAGRVCYKSEDKINDTSAENFVRMLIERGHKSALEHVSVTARIICDRGVSHEIVRHRLASYSQESTRYCNYGSDRFKMDIAFVMPSTITEHSAAHRMWMHACKTAENAYFDMLDYGCTPQEARSVLPNSLKTEIVMTANLREWRHFFRLRCAIDAHPDMRVIALDGLKKMKDMIPVVFDDIKEL